MGSVCSGASKGTVADATPAISAQKEGNVNANGSPLQPSRPPSQHGTGAVDENAVIQDIQRAVTPNPHASTKGDDEENYQIIRLLLLGAVESGKTTILEQIRIMFKQHFTEAELFHRKAFIYNTILRNVRTLVSRTRQMGLLYVNTQNESGADLILAQDETQYGHFTPEVEKAIISIWADKTTQHVYSKRSEINLNDSTKYFLDNLEKINKMDFRPTSNDLIMSYVPTVGIQNIIFSTNHRSFQLFDMGGQRIDRRKWATMYDGIDAIFFCLAISEYNQLMDEDGITNRLSDSMSLLEKIAQEPKFQTTPIFLFLNEVDVFREKLTVFPLSNHLPEYEGKSVEEALDFIEELATSRMEGHQKNYVYRTIAIETQSMSKILGEIFQIILKNN
ncbi:unnamed protein product, partial [Mesorhabditis belari]|uniref:Uncharacterized protein n=1 Tax=Mesorhabditis belari TaxID=2138241 RepID=A0AAF3F520_9BILA